MSSAIYKCIKMYRLTYNVYVLGKLLDMRLYGCARKMTDRMMLFFRTFDKGFSLFESEFACCDILVTKCLNKVFSFCEADMRGEVKLAGQLVQYGRRTRSSYARIREVLEVPNLIEIQQKSYEKFLEKDLREIFQDISPIQDFTGNLMLEFIDYQLGRT